ncbi:MAG TPA: ROK family protein [Candidatus Limnocylindrales bacterium]|nr:ROK family protein [Candidatus Limnocylindrales bacterium]
MDSAADGPVLAVDLGGTQIRTAVVTPDAAVHARRAEPTRDHEGPEALIRRLGELLAEARSDAAAAGLGTPIGIGISSPGPLDPWRGIVLDPPNLARWQNVPLGARVAEATGLPTFVERDTNVAARAEWRYGAARGATDLVYITVSTGVGGAAIIGGRPLMGPAGMAGEFGHLVVEIGGPRCGCGGLGHVEAIASGIALAREGAALVSREPDGELARLAAGGGAVDAALVARAAAEGDPHSAGLLERAWVAIGAMCASIVNALNPEVIVIGGGIAEHHPRLFEVARVELSRQILPALTGRTRIEQAALGRDVSLIGALPIVQERIGDPRFAAGSHRPQTAAAQQGVPRP